MLEFYEKVYFSELDRKSKIQTALAFPIGISVVAISAFRYALENVVIHSRCDYIVLIPLIPASAAFVFFLSFVGLFLNPGAYKYLWTLNALKDHHKELREFSERFPEAPSADETLEQHLMTDLAKCATHNALINDKRSEALYRSHISVFVLVLFALLSATMVMVDNKLIG